jgi:hypothetical protein
MINPEDLKDPFLFDANGLPRDLTWGIGEGDFEKDLADLNAFLRKLHADDPSVRITHLGETDDPDKHLAAFGVLKGGVVRPHQFWLSRVGHLMVEFEKCNRYEKPGVKN